MNKIPGHTSILQRFNDKDPAAFGEVYAMYYMEIVHFASKIYRDTEVNAGDAVHDAFVKIWQSKNTTFDDLSKIKSYTYVCIRNDFKNYITHKSYVDDFKQSVVNNKDRFICELIDSEVYSAVNQALSLLPKECAEVFKYIIDGWEIKEVAEKMGTSERTVYNRKYEAIAILKQKLPKDIILLLMISVLE